ncbi:hypothetical protein F8M41_023700 [Gigaspora margarita]|uniref:Uncharacterized protein n=1 Tax=Gigaspora margarita TaxID=4874 RepID=A0A8H4EH70_GIGMA|nr:hypothetical protein F8M41_023700 [Gigaspora margarita]
MQNINLESNIANLSNDDNLSKNLTDIFFKLEDNTYSKNLEVDPNTNFLDKFENTSQRYHKLSDDSLVSADRTPNNLCEVIFEDHSKNFFC